MILTRTVPSHALNVVKRTFTSDSLVEPAFLHAIYYIVVIVVFTCRIEINKLSRKIITLVARSQAKRLKLRYLRKSTITPHMCHCTC